MGFGRLGPEVVPVGPSSIDVGLRPAAGLCSRSFPPGEPVAVSTLHIPSCCPRRSWRRAGSIASPRMLECGQSPSLVTTNQRDVLYLRGQVESTRPHVFTGLEGRDLKREAEDPPCSRRCLFWPLEPACCRPCHAPLSSTVLGALSPTPVLGPVVAGQSTAYSPLGSIPGGPVLGGRESNLTARFDRPGSGRSGQGGPCCW